MREPADQVWEQDDNVRRTVVLHVVLAERLAAVAEVRGVSVNDLLVSYAVEGLRRDATTEQGGRR